MFSLSLLQSQSQVHVEAEAAMKRAAEQSTRRSEQGRQETKLRALTGFGSSGVSCLDHPVEAQREMQCRLRRELQHLQDRSHWQPGAHRKGKEKERREKNRKRRQRRQKQSGAEHRNAFLFLELIS